MTGEVTLTGRVLPVGGVREKVLAARRAGITTVLVPRHNEKDLRDLPAEVKAEVTFHLVDTLDTVVTHLFSVPKPGRRGRTKASKTPARRETSKRTVPLPPPEPPGPRTTARTGRRSRPRPA
jgi:ATP-dependent Lon protease